jgi:hypothetical protein
MVIPNSTLNLRADEKGIVHVTHEQLGHGHSHVLIVAVDGHNQATSKRFGMASAPPPSMELKANQLRLENAYRDTRLMPGNNLH